MKRKFLLIVFFLVGIIIFSWQTVTAAEKVLVPTDGAKTVKLGKQGLFILNTPTHVRFVEIEKLTPPLRPIYIHNVDLSYRGAALDITFLNSRLVAISPLPTQTSVYFNVSEPEVKLWQEGGVSEIGIWYYNKKSEEWRLCHPRLIPEREKNGKYDRLACFVMGNGIYVLGKMEKDPMFPLWFKLQNEGDVKGLMRIKDY